MSDFLKAKKLDITSGDNLICLINDKDAEQYGVGLNRGDRVELKIDNVEKPIIVVIDTTNDFVNEGQIGIYEDIWQKYGIEDDAVVELKLFNKSEAIEAIKKKLAGEELSYEDLYVIISDIASGHLSKIFKTLFIASGYSPGFNDQEIKHMTKALALTGEVLKFTGITADKHSIGGVAGKGITPIVVPIIAANGIIVPNTSTRAITSASATTDMLEVIMPMSFKKEQLEAMIEKSGAFMVWGGGLDLAPADDEIIKIQKAIGIESIDKFVSSILAKKIAQGVNTVIFDVPVGKGAKITEEEFDEVKTKHEFLEKQIVDLEKASQNLKKIIDDLNIKIEERFHQNFKKINETFNKYFQILFSGGHANLTIKKEVPRELKEEKEDEESNEEDSKEKDDQEVVEEIKNKTYEGKTEIISDILISVKLPGKKQANMTFLSGGEKALTSIALICAIIYNNPSPFVVLDEVDAALDEANSERFAEIVDNLKDKTQFICITHNRATMHKADRLYGVTMDDNSISKLLSISFNQAEQYSD